MIFINKDLKSFSIVGERNAKVLRQNKDYVEVEETLYNEIQEKMQQGYTPKYRITSYNGVDKLRVEYDEPKVDYQAKYQQEMQEIIAWLNANDYIINKHTLGEYGDNDERWLNYLAQRKVKLERYNELEVLVK